MPTKVNFVNIPQELKANASFCLWKLEKRNGKSTKVPYNPKTGAMARTNDASTFSDFVTAMKDYAMGGWDGIGYRVAAGETDAIDAIGANGGIGDNGTIGAIGGIGAIDIDHCIREDGSLNDVAASILGFFPETYFERSPSGTGLRGFFFLPTDFAYDKTVYYINNRKYGLEVYLPGATNRFVTVTGDVYRPGSVVRNDAALTSLLDTFMKRPTRMENTSISAPCSYLTDEQVIKHASASESGEKFSALYSGSWQELYDSQSDADMAFVSMLAFWCGNVEEQIDRIFRASGLMRGKWDRKTGDSTYGQITIRNAVSSNSNVYTPVFNAEPTSAEDEFADLDDEAVAGTSVGADGATGTADGTGEAGTGRADKRHKSFRPALSFITLTIEAMQPHTNPRYGHEEIGIGNIFADYYKPIARFNASRNIWFVYDGCSWRADENALAVAELAKLLADKLLLYALQIKDEDTRTRYIKRVQKLQLRKNRKTMIDDAKSVYPVTVDVFDRDHYLFNCENGTLDLRTLQFRGHDPKDFITKSSPVFYDPAASCPRWNQFITEVMQGKEDVARYLQKAIGYAMTGDTSLECLFIMYGPKTRNGKTTTIETILKVMGEYGRSAKPDMLASNFRNTGSSSGGPSEDVARLSGARFVGISEMEQKLTINASLTKQMTGNSSITARFLHENSFEFHLQAKIFIDTNHLPNVTDQTLFESGRIKIIPFERHFEDYEQDKGLKNKLVEEHNLSGILNWCVEGYRLFKAEGLEEPNAVQNATAQYRQDNDRFSQFADEWLEEGYDEKHFPFEVTSMAAYRVYTQWAEGMNFRADNVKNFRAAMEKMYSVERKHPRAGGDKTTVIVGARLRKEAKSAEEDGMAFKPLDDEKCQL